MKSNYDEIIRDSFSKKIEMPEGYQHKMKETLKQACIASSQKKQSPLNECFRADSRAKSCFQRHKLSANACLSLTGGICACLGFIIVLSVFLKQGRPGKDFNNTQKQYMKISASPAATKNTATADNSLRTEIPVDTESPLRTNLPIDTADPTLTTANTHIPEKKKKNDTGAAQTETDSKPDNSTTDNPEKDSTAKPKRTETTRSPELAQVQTSCTPETIETPHKTTTPENNTPQLTSVPKPSATPYSGIMFPTVADTPAATSVRASTIPDT